MRSHAFAGLDPLQRLLPERFTVAGSTAKTCSGSRALERLPTHIADTRKSGLPGNTLRMLLPPSSATVFTAEALFLFVWRLQKYLSAFITYGRIFSERMPPEE